LRSHILKLLSQQLDQSETRAAAAEVKTACAIDELLATTPRHCAAPGQAMAAAPAPRRLMPRSAGNQALAAPRGRITELEAELLVPRCVRSLSTG
jgi:hypothetical protein